MPRCAVVVPTRDEAGAVGEVVRRILGAVDADVVVVDNGSTDGTAALAAAAGALVVVEGRRGYGNACRAGVARVPEAACVVFIDGDGSMAPEDIPRLLAPILEGRADIVCGSRTRRADPGSMPAHQALGNRVALLLLHRLYGVTLSDLGPFRAVEGGTLRALSMRPSRYAWPAEMLARAARRGARIVEVDVAYHRRTAGRSKVGGTVRGSVGAGAGIIGALLWQRLRPAAGLDSGTERGSPAGRA